MAERSGKVVFVPDEVRNFGDNGAECKVILDPGGEVQVATSRDQAPALIAFLKTLVGTEVTVPGDETQYGFRSSREFRFPGDPRKPPGQGGGGGRGRKGSGDFESHKERGWNAKAMLYMSILKSVASMTGEGGLSQAFGIDEVAALTDTIFDRAMAKLGDYPFKTPEELAASQGQGGGQPSSNGSAQPKVAGRIGEILEATGNNTGKVLDAKRFATQQYETADLDKLDEDQWSHVLATVVLA